MNLFFPRILLFISVFGATQCFSQSDSSYRAEVTINMLNAYNSTLGVQSPLFNGKIHQPFPFSFTGSDHIYFISDYLSPGSVVYNGVLYEKLDLMYDLSRDELVMRYDDENSLVLDKSRVTSFSLLNHNFIKLSDTPSELNKEQYYDLQYDGAIKFLIKRKKNVTEPVPSKQTTPIGRIRSITEYYIVKDSVFHLVKNKSSLLEILKQNNRANKEYLKQNNQNFKKNAESMIAALVELYDKKFAGKK